MNRQARRRRRRFFRVGIIVIAVLAGRLAWGWFEKAEASATRRHLDSILVPAFQMAEAPPPKVAETIDRLIAGAPGGRQGIRVRVATADETRKRCHRQMLPHARLGATPVLTLRMDEAPLFGVRARITEVTAWTFEFRGRGVLIHLTQEPSTADELLWRTFRMTLPMASGDPRTAFAARGVIFYEGCAERHDPRSGRLRVRNTRRELERIADLLGATSPSPWRQVAEDWTGSVLQWLGR